MLKVRIIKNVFILLFVVFLIAQFFNPEKNEGALTSTVAFIKETKPPERVKIILKETCFNCHSDVSRYPWYNSITPVNYWLAAHVKEGKKHFNASQWEGNSVKRKDHKFKELIDMVKNREMPLNCYSWGHSEAQLSNSQIKAIINWAKLVRLNYSLKPKPE